MDMKLTIWEPKTPATVDDLKNDFARKVGAFRAATGRPERFVTRCACAIHDKGFSVAYERTDPARPFILTGIYKDGEGDSGGSTSASRSRTLPSSEIDHTGWRCPYCANESHHIACDRCDTTVCGGRTRRYPGTADIFACRESCGARGTLVESKTVGGVEPTRSPVSSKPISERLPSPSADALRLGAPKPPRLK
ncbi:hypothetical protein BC358_06195 [Hydrogenophaga sp. H7]|nr:hypothetical protein BC358_06195 [Hydrogenophaga sp. H7]